MKLRGWYCGFFRSGSSQICEILQLWRENLHALECATLIFCEIVKFCVWPDREDGQDKYRLISGREQLWVSGGNKSNEEEIMFPACARANAHDPWPCH